MVEDNVHENTPHMTDGQRLSTRAKAIHDEWLNAPYKTHTIHAGWLKTPYTTQTIHDGWSETLFTGINQMHTKSQRKYINVTSSKTAVQLINIP